MFIKKLTALKLQKTQEKTFRRQRQCFLSKDLAEIRTMWILNYA
jgi:hypothetical protein